MHPSLLRPSQYLVGSFSQFGRFFLNFHSVVDVVDRRWMKKTKTNMKRRTTPKQSNSYIVIMIRRRSSLLNQMWNEVKFLTEITETTVTPVVFVISVKNFISFHIWWSKLDLRNIMITKPLLNYCGVVHFFIFIFQLECLKAIASRELLMKISANFERR